MLIDKIVSHTRTICGLQLAILKKQSSGNESCCRPGFILQFIKRRKIILFFPAFFFLSCSSSPDQKARDKNYDTLSANQQSPPRADTLPHPSEEFKKFVHEAKEAGFFCADTAHIYACSDHKNYFSLADRQRVFTAFEDALMMHAKNTVVVLKKKIKKGMAVITAEEWQFMNEEEAKYIDNALTQPMKDKTEVRFLAAPFTFFRLKNKMYYLYTEAESTRKEMDRLNTLLTSCVTPEALE